MPDLHLLSFYGSSDPQDGYAERQRNLHLSAAQYGGISVQHPWNKDKLMQTSFYKAHQEILDASRGSGYWLWKPYLLLETLKEIAPGDYLMYHDVGRAIRREPGVGYRFTRPIEPMVDWAENHGGMFPGIYVPIYGTNGMWTKRDCFVLMDCDSEQYWNSPMVQASIHVWKNTPEVREFIEEWLEFCKNPRIITDQDNECGLSNLPEFKDHRHDQSILTNLLIKKGIPAYGDPRKPNFKHRDVGFISCHAAVEKLVDSNQHGLQHIALQHKSYRLERGYVPFYQLLMEEKRELPLTILELQSNHNESSILWSEYLPNARITRIGLKDPSNEFAIKNKNSVFQKLDPGHRPTMESFSLQTRQQNISFDYIIDAGSGLMHDQQLAIGTLFDLLKPEGIFIIEAMEKSQTTETGDLRQDRSNSTLQLIKKINLPPYRITSHYFSRAESLLLEKIIDTAGVYWIKSHDKQAANHGIGMIRRVKQSAATPG